MKILTSLLAIFALTCPTIARANFSITVGSGTTIVAVDAANQGTSACAAASTECPATVLMDASGTILSTTSHVLNVNSAASVADGSDITLGATTQAACASFSTTGCTLIQLARLQAQLTGSSVPAGTAIIGKVGIDQTTDITTNGVEIAPTAASAAGIAPVVSAALESNHVIKASAGNFYDGYITTGATAGFLLLVNSASAPTAGGAAITPLACVVAPANLTTSIGASGLPPMLFSTGIVMVFSTSGCLTNTASATVFFSGRVK